MARIGIDARYLETENTGIGRYSFNLLTHLLEQDRENAYWVFIRDEYEGRLPSSELVTYVRVPYPPISLSSLFAMSLAVRRLHLDLWHAHFPVVPFFSGTPFVVTVHDLQPLRVPSLGGQRSLPLRLAYRIYYPLAYTFAIIFSKAIVAVSLATCKEIREVFRVPQNKIRVIHEALDDRFSPTSIPAGHQGESHEPYSLPSQYLLYVGATLPHKNLDAMLKGFARAMDRPETKDLFLVIAGRPSRFEPQWTELMERLGISRRVLRIGYVSQEHLPYLYQKATALLYLSCYEGFGFPPLEAMQHGVPVIAALHSSLPEIVGPAGIFVSPDDLDGIANAIVKVLTDVPLRDRLAEYGRRNLKRFTWGKAAAQTLSLYTGIVDKAATSP